MERDSAGDLQDVYYNWRLIIGVFGATCICRLQDTFEYTLGIPSKQMNGRKTAIR